MKRAFVWAFASFWGFASLELYAAKEPSPIYVRGYPVEYEQSVDILSSGPDHPILGRLACPSLTRLNLLKQSSESFLLKNLDVIETDGKVTWQFELRDNVYWWGGDRVRVQDLEAYFNQTIHPLVASLGLNQWQVPKFDTQVSDESLKIVWTQKPVFGPYIFNRSPLTRGHHSGLECAGTFRHSIEKSQLVFKPTSQEPIGRPILVFSNVDQNTKRTKVDLDFEFPRVYLNSEDKLSKAANNSAQCSRPIDLPVVTLIYWNLEREFTKNEAFRRALAGAIPRQALVGVGAGGLGDIITGPLLRAHPGYNHQLKLEDFQLSETAKKLEDLGFKRPFPDGVRMTPKGERFELTFYADEGGGLVKKVVVDSLNMLGIKVKFTNQKTPEVDAVLSGASLSWPHGDFMDWLHSKSEDDFPFWSLKDPDLDNLLEKYALSLTHEKPDFDILKNIHKVIYDKEPFTILVQHRSCLSADPTFRSKLPPVIIRNPDWFYELISG